MHILITNDDGISSNAMHALAQKLSMNHTVLLVAPATEQSGVGHAFSFRKLIKVSEQKSYAYQCYTVAGTPADCIKFAYFELLKEQKPDLVLSGINDGHNTGVGCFYSGTVGGAREGMLLGIPSIAVSAFNHSEKNISESIQWTVNFIEEGGVEQLTSESLWNINIPDVDSQKIVGTRFCRMSTVMYNDVYVLENEGDQPEYSFSGSRPEEEFIVGTDDHTVLQGYVAVVPLKTDQTDDAFLETQRDF